MKNGQLYLQHILECINNIESFENVIRQMAQGTTDKGINCIIVNSEVEEIDMETNEKLDAMMEVNIETEGMMNKLNQIYDGWEIVKQLVKPLEYKIIRNKRDVLLKTNAITFVVRKR